MADQNNQTLSTLAKRICDQISSIFSKPTDPYPTPLELLVSEIAAVSGRNGRVFLYGVGREGLMIKALCMRLAHLGLSASLVLHDFTAPSITAADLLVASAGPGGFATVDAICAIARSNGARVLVLTARPETGSSVRHATAVCYVPARTMAEDGGDDTAEAAAEEENLLLPMGSLYEGALFVLFEAVVFRLTEVLGQSPEAVRSRHTNLE